MMQVINTVSSVLSLLACIYMYRAMLGYKRAATNWEQVAYKATADLVAAEARGDEFRDAYLALADERTASLLKVAGKQAGWS